MPVASDFHFAAGQDGLHAWRYLDLTAHVRYLSELIRTTVELEMVREAAEQRLLVRNAFVDLVRRCRL